MDTHQKVCKITILALLKNNKMLQTHGNNGYFAINIAQISIQLLALMIHSLGIFFLCQIKETRTTQNLILIHLSFIEIPDSNSISDCCRRCHYPGDRQKTFESLYLFGAGIYMTFYLIMIALTLDRLAMSFLSINYYAIIMRERMKIALLAFWPIGVICGAVFVKLQSYKVLDIIFTLAGGRFLVLTILPAHVFSINC